VISSTSMALLPLLAALIGGAITDARAQHLRGQQDAAVNAARPVRNQTRPSDKQALLALYDANGRQGTLLGWGVGDPCVGEAGPEQANAQGFGPWKGVACAPCPEDARYFCVTQIWQHQKSLNGTIPETFRGLTELTWLFLSANNLTGPLPTTIWSTLPKLRMLDLSYNTINGVLPLDAMSSCPELNQILVNDNHFDAVRYSGGGFESLEELNFKYNRNMSGTFPAALSELPELRNLQIHDSNLIGRVPDGPWPSMRTLVISGTGGLCGPLPSVCGRGGSWCDVSSNFSKCTRSLTALFVVGTDPDARCTRSDHVFLERLEAAGYTVTLVRDTTVNTEGGAHCDDFDAMLISASISGGAVGDRLTPCKTPQLIWEVGIYYTSSMSGPTLEDAWVTNRWWNTYHQDAWEKTGYWPPAPTGPNLLITEEGSKCPLAVGVPAGEVPFFEVKHFETMDYGVNWASVDKLGAGAKVVAILPRETTVDWPSEAAPKVDKAVLFYYEKGAELYGGGKSPALRIGFPPYGFDYASEPSCEELAGVPDCAICHEKCKSAEWWRTQDIDPMPLSETGLKMLDASIQMLVDEANKNAGP